MGFEEIPFSELLCNVVDNRGRTCPTANAGIPLIATNCIRNELLYPTYDKVRFVSQHTYSTWFRGHPKPGDILFVNKATPGRVCLVPDPVDFCIAQDMVAVRADPGKIYPKFLFAALRSPIAQERIGQMHVGTLIPHFKKGDFDKLLLPLPSREVQEFIGDIYFDLSAKIDLNRRMNETLEAMARALFKSWFVDFDPVRAKAEGRDPGLPKPLADLFPDSFEDSELGEIPKGWRVSSILDTAHLMSGGTPKTDRDEYWSGDIPWASAKDVSQCRESFLLETERMITARGLEESATQLIPALCSVVVARGATTGRMVLLGNAMAINQTCYALATAVNTPFALYCSLRQEIGNLVHSAHGSVFDTITTSTFGTSKVILPPRPVLVEFESSVDPLFRRVLAETKASHTLAALRDTLLPKLISGELRVPEAERLLERTL